MRKGFSVTYDIVTPESAADGDVADSGYLLEDCSLRDAIREMDHCLVQPSVWPFDPSYPWLSFYEVDGETDVRTGETTSKAFHLPDNLTTSTRARIARLLGVK